jgi:hypothetical protein
LVSDRSSPQVDCAQVSGAQSYRDWHLPFTRDRITLREARASLRAVGAGQQEVPIMVQLVENPKFSMPGFRLFHGAVDLKRHDDIHLALGRGLLPKDEAFAIGFTMGTSNKVSTAEEKLFGWISKHLYPVSTSLPIRTCGCFGMP